MASSVSVTAILAFVLLFAACSTQSINNGVTSPASPPPPPDPGDYYRICPLPACKSCPSAEEMRRPGIGFALEMGFGTAALRLHDGSIHDITLIEGDEVYKSLMRRLLTGPRDRIPDDSDTISEKWQYIKKRTQRLANKLVGRPANLDIAILASMVSKLLEATQTWLGEGQPIVAAVLSSPDHIKLTEEEIGDVFDHLGIRNLMLDGMKGPNSLYQLYGASAAYAGYGKGLCSNYTDAYGCEQEEWYFRPQNLLHLDYSPESLCGTLKSLQSARDGSVEACFVDLDLGLTGEDDASETYWTAVSDRIRKLAESRLRYVYMRHVTDVVLTGPSAADSRFRNTVKDALHDLVDYEDVLNIFEQSGGASKHRESDWRELFKFATAMGAAEIAKRRQEGPIDCRQGQECRRLRERVHGEQTQKLVNQQ